MKKIFFILIIILNINLIFAAESRTAADFLLLDVGARPISLGGAYCALAEDILSIEYNPAGTSIKEKNEFAFSHTEYIGDANYEYVAFKTKLFKKYYFGTSVKIFAINDIERDNSGIKKGEFSNKDYLLTLNASRKFSSIFLGMNLKFLTEEIYHRKFTNYFYDLGFLSDIKMSDETKKLRIGASVLNISSELKYGDYSFDAPMILKFGCSYFTQLFKKNITITGELQAERNSDIIKILGLEYYLKSYFVIRCGMKSSSEYDDISSLNFGIGVIQKIGAINYSYKSFGDIGNSHSVTLTLEY